MENWSRLGRSTKDLLELVDFFSSENVQVISDKEKFGTFTSQGKVMLSVFRAFAEFDS
ncbi:recombinase family protein [Enterococcus ureasiticus]|uniref:recombinase family protein n=1 Tax=Enterococcus ureasiticus TaxID=903984 RepID=UPI001F0AD384|nr:recombinase family protein [Enterococcus ureasiticus]